MEPPPILPQVLLNCYVSGNAAESFVSSSASKAVRSLCFYFFCKSCLTR
uniref:Uncharacterized protein n=1 Tax=Anguilla anguilla TaxID=7936 RepID=A0A0E9V125_ANGAN